MSFVIIIHFKNHKMTLRILLMSLLPLLSFAQSNSKVAMPKNTQSNDKGPVELKRNALYNLDEIKVRWKKAALENCPGVPCPTFSVPGPCSSIVAAPTSPSSASVSFVPPTSDGGSPITGYIVTATSTPSAPAKRKSSSVITVTGTSSPIVVTGLTFGVNYIFSVVATNAAGGSPPITTTTTVTPCTLNTAGTASSITLIVNTALTPSITIATTGATGIGTATGLPAGVTAVWASNVITISGTPTAAGTFNYTIPLTGGCGSVDATGTITVSACTPNTAGTASPITLIVNTALTPSITITTTGATGIGTATGLPAGVTAVWASNVITISGTPAASGTFNYTIPLTGGCGSVNATGTITVSSCTPNTAGTASPITLIVNTALTPSITIATTGATGIGTATGLPAGVTAVWASNVITISGTPTAAGTFNYTIPLTGGCGSVNATGTITVSACPTPTITDIDGNTYNTVSIGIQCWMRENLRVRRYNNGTEIRFDASGTSTGTTGSPTWSGTGREYGAHTIYAHDSATTTPSNLTSYGYLYNWYAAKGIYKTGVIASTDTLNICPSGWHVPSDSDWNKLVIFIDSDADTNRLSGNYSTSAGKKLKKNHPLWTTNTGNDDSGFSALPGGTRANGGSFGGSSLSIGNVASFWSVTQYLGVSPYHHQLNHNNDNVRKSATIYKSLGASVRCLID